MSVPKLQADCLVALKTDPSRRGLVLRVSRNGKRVHVKFEGYHRATQHAAEGLILLSTTPQAPLFDDLFD